MCVCVCVYVCVCNVLDYFLREIEKHARTRRVLHIYIYNVFVLLGIVRTYIISTIVTVENSFV